MKIDVVGGSGFIGTRVCERLKQAGHDFAILDKQKSGTFPDNYQFADVRSIQLLRSNIRSGCALIHLAAEHRDDVVPLSLYEDVNVQGAINICEVAKEKGVATIVFTSSVAVYGFAPVGTDETGAINPFNEYGRTKFAAEDVLRRWQAEAPADRTLVIIRPTVVFGEKNRGNVYNLLRQIASGNFVMIGSGQNRKSMAYVENVAAFIEHALTFSPGLHLFNYVDKPDFSMNGLVDHVRRILGRKETIRIRLPYPVGYVLAKGFDLVAAITGRKLTISSIRVKKFCADSVYKSGALSSDFVPPIPLEVALERTIRYEFLEHHSDAELFYTE